VPKEQTGLFRTDGKTPDDLTLVPWQSGKSLCWDVTVICSLTESYVTGFAREAGASAELAASRKAKKSANTGGQYLCASRSEHWALIHYSFITIYKAHYMSAMPNQRRRTRQLAKSLPIWEERSPQPQAMRRKELFCSKELRCWCNATTLSCYMIPCQPLTARTDDMYPILYYLNF